MNKIITTLAATGVEIDKLTEDTTDLTTATQSIVSGIIGALALVAVVVMIIGGVNYMTSSGDAGKVKKAKDTILYGLIGLIVCALAFAIVNFVISNVLNQSKD